MSTRPSAFKSLLETSLRLWQVPDTLMNLMLGFFLWCLLLVLCWPVAVLALILIPIVWLVALPFRLAITAVDALLTFIKALLFLPARLLGARPRV